MLWSRRKKLAWREACTGETRNARWLLVDMLDGKRTLGWPKHRWKNITLHHKERGWEDMQWIHVAQDRDKWYTSDHGKMSLWILHNVENLTSWSIISWSNTWSMKLGKYINDKTCMQYQEVSSRTTLCHLAIICRIYSTMHKTAVQTPHLQPKFTYLML